MSGMVRLLLILLIIGGVACDTDPLTTAKKNRISYDLKEPQQITMALVWPKETTDSFAEGLQRAVDEINQSGGINGATIKLTLADDSLNTATAKNIARTLIEDRSLQVVIGHPNAETALAAAVIYEHAGVLFIAAGSSSATLTATKFEYIIRPTPDDTAIATFLV